MNFPAILVATIVTLPIGFIWYHKSVFGTVWMRESGVTEESARKANMIKVFGLTLILSFRSCWHSYCLRSSFTK